MLPEHGSNAEMTFFFIDAVITSLFTLELIMNIFCHSHNFVADFLCSVSNWFDALIVLASLSNVIFFLLMDAGSVSPIPNAKLFRMIRLGRVVRLFSQFKSLQKLINAVSSAILPVCNAFLLLLIIAAVYAILGTYFFRDKQPLYFRDFLTSLFTMFQVLSGDSWASNVGRSMFSKCVETADGDKDCKTETDVAFFFISYLLIASIMLLNVVVAVLVSSACPE